MSNRNARKKQSEHEAFAILASRLPIDGIESVVADESPDFVVATSSGKIGIEIVSLLHDSGGESGSSLRRDESVQDKLLAEAYRLWEQAGLQPVSLGVHFLSHETIAGAAIKELARILVKKAKAILPHGEMQIATWDQSKDYHTPYLMPHGEERDEALFIARYVDSFTLLTLRTDASIPLHVHAPRAGYVRTCSAADIEAVIATHDDNVQRYRTAGVEKLWLLIDAGGGAPSSLWHFDSCLECTYRTNFNRVFICQKIPTLLHTLRTARHPTSENLATKKLGV